MHNDLLGLELMAPDSQHHNDIIQFSPVDIHELIPEVDSWELALTPMTLEVTAETQVAGICKKFSFSTGDPLGPIQQAEPIPSMGVLQPPINVLMELLVQLDSVMEMVSFLWMFQSCSKERLYQVCTHDT